MRKIEEAMGMLCTLLFCYYVVDFVDDVFLLLSLLLSIYLILFLN